MYVSCYPAVFLVDVDECALGNDNCADQALCENTVGSFSCQCSPGFNGDGRTCSKYPVKC